MTTSYFPKSGLYITKSDGSDVESIRNTPGLGGAEEKDNPGMTQFCLVWKMLGANLL